MQVRKYIKKIVPSAQNENSAQKIIESYYSSINDIEYTYTSTNIAFLGIIGIPYISSHKKKQHDDTNDESEYLGEDMRTFAKMMKMKHTINDELLGITSISSRFDELYEIYKNSKSYSFGPIMKHSNSRIIDLKNACDIACEILRKQYVYDHTDTHNFSNSIHMMPYNMKLIEKLMSNFLGEDFIILQNASFFAREIPNFKVVESQLNPAYAHDKEWPFHMLYDIILRLNNILHAMYACRPFYVNIEDSKLYDGPKHNILLYKTLQDEGISVLMKWCDLWKLKINSKHTLSIMMYNDVQKLLKWFYMKPNCTIQEIVSYADYLDTERIKGYDKEGLRIKYTKLINYDDLKLYKKRGDIAMYISFLDNTYSTTEKVLRELSLQNQHATEQSRKTARLFYWDKIDEFPECLQILWGLEIYSIQGFEKFDVNKLHQNTIYNILTNYNTEHHTDGGNMFRTEDRDCRYVQFQLEKFHEAMFGVYKKGS